MQKEKEDIGIVWFTNNLRVQDNYILKKTLESHSKVLGLYCFDPRHFEKSPWGFKKTEKFRAQFLIETVTNLKENLEQLGIPLYVYQDKPEDILPKIISNFKVSAIYFQKEWTYEELNVIKAVKKVIPKNIKLNSYYDQFLFHPEDISMTIDSIPKIFTVFRKQVERDSEVRPTLTIKTGNTKTLENLTRIPTLSDLGFTPFETHPNSAFTFKGGESSALKRLSNYVFETKKIGFYKKTRNGLLGPDYSSKLSSWLANGSISARTIYWAVKKFEEQHFKNESTYWLIFELMWRDYFKYVSLKHGNKIFKLGGILDKKYSWSEDSDIIKKWIQGETSESFVNANMIELKNTGWMSNRGRQNVASYLTKNLNIDWRIGASYFESMLIDYDVHSNYGNWMYVAGVGNDPRDRVFNVKLQAERYDPNGKFQNLWLQPTLF